MKFHIVRTNETLEDILFLYNLEKDELTQENKHVRVWNKLAPGTKIRIPTITEAINQDVLEMEPFVEDYYPKIKTEEDLIITSDEKSMDETNPYVEEPIDIIKEEASVEKETRNTLTEEIIEESLENKDLKNEEISQVKETPNEVVEEALLKEDLKNEKTAINPRQFYQPNYLINYPYYVPYYIPIVYPYYYPVYYGRSKKF